MPIYEYECTVCGRRVEEIQKFEDPPPVLEDLCPGPPRDDAASRDQELARLQAEPVPCLLERRPTTFTQRWPGDHSNDGRGGWVRQGEAMVKMTPGKNSTKYGEGSV